MVDQTDCACCLQNPVTNPEHKDRSNGPSNAQPLCEACYYGMDQSLDEHGNLLPEALFFTQDDDESPHS